MAWTSAHHVFAGETFFKTGEFAVAILTDLHAYFILHADFLFRKVSFQCNMKWAQKALCIAITDSPVLKINLKANTCNAPIQARIITDHIGKKMVKHLLDGATIATCPSLFATHKWQVKMWKAFL